MAPPHQVTALLAGCGRLAARLLESVAAVRPRRAVGVDQQQAQPNGFEHIAEAFLGMPRGENTGKIIAWRHA